MFLILAPVILTTVIYTIFHKISTAIAPQSVLYKSSLMLKVFSGMDIICQIAISVGAMMASKAPVYFIGKGILLAGIAVHISTMLAFVSTVVVWQRRVRGKWTSDLDNYTKSTEKDLLAVYIATGLIVVRSLFRFIEFASGPVCPNAMCDHLFQANIVRTGLFRTTKRCSISTNLFPWLPHLSCAVGGTVVRPFRSRPCLGIRC